MKCLETTYRNIFLDRIIFWLLLWHRAQSKQMTQITLRGLS